MAPAAPHRIPTRTRAVSRRAVLGGTALAAAASFTTRPAEAAVTRPIRFLAWEGLRSWRSGQSSGVAAGVDGHLRLFNPSTTTIYADPHGTTRTYQQGTWTSPWLSPGIWFDQLVASWNAITPVGTWVEIAVRVASTTGTPGAAATSGWFVMARWTSGDSSADIGRTSVAGQSTTWGRVEVDTFVAASGTKYPTLQVRVRLFRPADSRVTPVVTLASVVASAVPAATSSAASLPGVGRGIVLPVPAWSQEIHAGHFPQWNGGGEAWCSPTSTAMVAAYWGKGFTAAESAWVGADPRPQVDATARAVFDRGYGACGNWAFNTAWAGTRGLRSFVTRLRSLAEAELFIKAGIPLITSVSFAKAQLTGAGYGTNGHLMVIVGFDAAGNVVCNDPASHLVASDAQVRVTYNRLQFENVWLPKTGTVYVMAPRGHALPTPPGQRNWA